MNPELLTENVFPLPGGLMLRLDELLNHACLRPLSGREEEWLARHSAMPSAARVTWVLQACILSLNDHPVTPDLVRQLLVADRDYLILQLRRLTLGDQVQAVVSCPGCNQKMDVAFQANEVPVEFRPQSATSYTVELQDRTVRFRLPTGGDQEAVLAARPEGGVTELLQRCILDDGNRELSAEEQNTVIAAMEQLAPQVELELDLTCPECSRHFSAPFDMTAFFFEEMAYRGQDLLHEVHALASYYHWSESEILSLERNRRRAYLNLLNESLRQ
jgi:hypothetical protein